MNGQNAYLSRVPTVVDYLYMPIPAGIGMAGHRSTARGATETHLLTAGGCPGDA